MSETKNRMTQFEDGAITEYECASGILLSAARYLLSISYPLGLEPSVAKILGTAYDSLAPDKWMENGI